MSAMDTAFLHLSPETDLGMDQTLALSFLLGILKEIRGSAVSVVNGYTMDNGGTRVKSHDRVKNFNFSTSSKTALRPTQPPVQWVLGIFHQR
jgi:hypothetical protein